MTIDFKLTRSSPRYNLQLGTPKISEEEQIAQEVEGLIPSRYGLPPVQPRPLPSDSSRELRYEKLNR